MRANIVKRIMQNEVLEKEGKQKVAFYMGAKFWYGSTIFFHSDEME
jgi:hypothetical protein